MHDLHRLPPGPARSGPVSTGMRGCLLNPGAHALTPNGSRHGRGVWGSSGLHFALPPLGVSAEVVRRDVQGAGNSSSSSVIRAMLA